MPKREQEVCQRLRQARDLVRLTQEEFAEQVGINRQRLASYEEFRAPLRWDLALRICRQFIISEKWLATGQGSKRQLLDLISEPFSYRIPLDAPYGEVYDNFLAAAYEAIRLEQGDNMRIQISEKTNLEFSKNLLLCLIEQWTKDLPATRTVPPDFDVALCSFLTAQGLDFVKFFLATGRLPTEHDCIKVHAPPVEKPMPVADKHRRPVKPKRSRKK